MKKTYPILVSFLMLLIPFSAFAAVNIEMVDNTKQDVQEIKINIDTEADLAENIVLPIEFSSDVTVVNISKGDVECSTFSTDDGKDDNIAVINCELEKPTALNGVLAIISFTSTEESYTFKLLENEALDLGELSVGEVVNIGVPEQDTAVALEEGQQEGTPVEDDLLVTPQDTQAITTTSESGFSLDNITEYLPYILIGASVILLISIIVILLTKKKPTKEPKESESSPQEASKEEPTLRNMVNKEVPQSAPVETGTYRDIQPPQPSQFPFEQNVPQVPPQQREPVANIAPETQEDDLQEILKREGGATPPESQGIQDTPFNPSINLNTGAMPPSEQMGNPPVAQNIPQEPPQTPPENPEIYMRNNPSIVQPDYESQGSIDREIGQMQRTSPPTDAPGIIPPNQQNNFPDLNMGSTPTVEPNPYPPVPGNINQQQDDGNTEDIPPAPPLM